ncbi:MAG: transporter substrate-binding domain-containing protein [Alphaproteobacteria bacterium]|nr:transporter substrate-binding domain-containing protein [Alphaproteobacteria bacterium]
MKRRTFLTTAAAVGASPAIVRAQAGSGPVIDQIKQRGVLRAGLSTFVPWAMRDKQGGLIGFELDVGSRLAQDLGVKYEPTPTAWDGIIPALLAGRFDFIIGGMSITEARSQQVDFSEPYSTSGLLIAANIKLAPNHTKVSDFDRPDYTLTCRRGSTVPGTLSRLTPKATVRQFDDDAQAQQEVINGRAHGVVTSVPKPNFAVIENPTVLYLPVKEVFEPQREGIAMRKNDPTTLAAVSDWVKARHADGFLKARRAYWFESRDWANLVAQS